jgi:hypothetical protein
LYRTASRCNTIRTRCAGAAGLWRFFGNARRSHSGVRLGWNNGKA